VFLVNKNRKTEVKVPDYPAKVSIFAAENKRIYNLKTRNKYENKNLCVTRLYLSDFPHNDGAG
jgi:hypothetical protein